MNERVPLKSQEKRLSLFPHKATYIYVNAYACVKDRANFNLSIFCGL